MPVHFLISHKPQSRCIGAFREASKGARGRNRWDHEEIHRDQDTCRPISALPDWDAFMESMADCLHNDALRIFVLWDTTTKTPLGRVTTFDHNPRNRSAEFGYYLPPLHRKRGHGRAMVQQFLAKMFCR